MTTPCAPKASADRTFQKVGQFHVTERRDGERDALVHQPAGHPLELVAADFQQRQVAVAGQPDGFGHALVGLDPDGDVERARGHLGAQRLGHRVTPEQQLRRFFH